MVPETVHCDAAVVGHGAHSGKWFESADEYATGFTVRLTGDVEAIMVTINKVNVSVTGRAE